MKYYLLPNCQLAIDQGLLEATPANLQRLGLMPKKEKWVPKVGDRVRVYDYSRIKLANIIPDGLVGFPDSVRVLYDEKDSFENLQRDIVHIKQCRRLIKKPREKSVRVTREKLEKAWDDIIPPRCGLDSSENSQSFKDFCKNLGLES